jgi:porin
VTNFAIVQPLSENLILQAGKLRLPAIADRNILAGGDGSDQFLNQAFCINPLYVPQIPISTFVVGAASPQEWGAFGLTVVDPQERSTEFMDLGSLFSTGVIIKGQVRFNTQFFDQPGQHHFGGFYKHVDLLNLEFAPVPPSYPEQPVPPGTPQFQTLPSSYTIIYGFDQYVTTYGPPTRLGHSPGWGVFGRAGIADGATGNPNFSAWHLSLGIGGECPLRTRRDKGDRFGIGYGYTGISTEYGAIPTALFGPRDGQAFESYYSWQATPAVAVSPDFQWIRGSLARLTNDGDAFVFGIRMNVRL